MAVNNPTQVFRRNSTWRKGVLRTLVTDLLVHGAIETTEARAKEVRKHAERMITKAKKGTLASRRDVEAFLRPIEKDGLTAGKYLFDKVAPKYKDRQGGYTRIIKSPTRSGDNTKMAIIELV